jgi:hypothetical protein
VTEPTDARERAIEAGARLLYEHGDGDGPGKCDCGWRATPGEADYDAQHDAHVAAAVLDAALATGAVVPAPTDPLIPVNRMRAAEARCAELEAECERHRRANLVRAVMKGERWETEDAWIVEAINSESWDAVPWRVADYMKGRLAEAEKLLRAMEGGWDAWMSDETGEMVDMPVEQIAAIRAFLAEGASMIDARDADFAEREAERVAWRDRSIAASNRAGQFRFEAEGLRDRLAAVEELLRDWQKWYRRGHFHDPRPIIRTEAFLAEGDT